MVLVLTKVQKMTAPSNEKLHKIGVTPKTSQVIELAEAYYKHFGSKIISRGGCDQIAFDLVDKFKPWVAVIVAAGAMKNLEDRLSSLGLSQEHYEEYGRSLQIYQEEDNIILRFQPESWLIEAMENGCPPFSIKEAMLSKKSKISSKGYRYRSVSISDREKRGTPQLPLTESSEAVISDSKTIIRGLKYKYKLIFEGNEAGGYVRKESFFIPSSDETKKPRKAFDRIRQFRSETAFKTRQRPRTTVYQNIRTMSDNPESLSDWEHPGFNNPFRIFENMIDWCENETAKTIEELIKEDIAEINSWR